MFEKTSRLAEQVATSVSRRGFLGSLGGWAATAAMGVAGLLVSPREAHASTLTCCWYGTGGVVYWKQCVLGDKKDCPATSNGYPLLRAFHVLSCGSCILA